MAARNAPACHPGEIAVLESERSMSEPAPRKPEGGPPTLGNTILLSGLCFAAGLFPLLIGLGVISGNVEAGPAGRALAIVAGLVLIFGGVMVVLRDSAGVRNNENIPASAPRWIRAGESLIGIAVIAAFAALCSIVAFGPFVSADMRSGMVQQMGTGGAALFRVVMGGFGIVFWYAAVWLAISKLRGGANESK
jgi:hypothetical protein